mmetsp:Transcript_62033/g.142030  ORF Transcript_62033/g.142030 Transcript_62033/m.142030 type:complete len:134 (+) Transcript_62033:34-435(+)
MLARTTGMLRAAAVRASALPAVRLAPTALPHARAMTLGREEGDDVIKKKMMDKLLKMKLDHLKDYDVKVPVSEATLELQRSKVEEMRKELGITDDKDLSDCVPTEVSKADKDTPKGRIMAYEQIKQYKAEGLL